MLLVMGKWWEKIWAVCQITCGPIWRTWVSQGLRFAIGKPVAMARPCPGSDYPECAFATYATHDHESIPAMWNVPSTGMLGGHGA